ncbi:hypothetical protein [Sandarakinorhabdus oryzae]|uniref:hypothetical protein n=1 Tax=Sandarakinorhabdus oryzae TaxID=2675220 RepID=UPI0012E2C249|nr:hypothetical protein [Sandarakinorhabdus oryzae]
MRALILPLFLAAAPALAQTPAPAAPSTPVTRGCLSLVQIQSTNVVDEQTIDFRLRDGSVWRNRLPRSCPGLGFDRAFSYSTSIPQLCNVDLIRVIVQNNPGIMGATCGLGKFERLSVRATKAKAKG